MKIVIIAAAVPIGISRASDNGAATGTDSVSVGALKKPPLRTIRGIELRAWTPVGATYNAEANGDLAARNIWGEE
jgi:hypothetical protein